VPKTIKSKLPKFIKSIVLLKAVEDGDRQAAKRVEVIVIKNKRRAKKQRRKFKLQRLSGGCPRALVAARLLASFIARRRRIRSRRPGGFLRLLSS
jgi:hypothetical protein